MVADLGIVIGAGDRRPAEGSTFTGPLSPDTEILCFCPVSAASHESTGERMRMSSIARIVAGLAVLATAGSAHAQGSWLPYGTLGASDIAVNPNGVVWLIGRDARSLRTALVLAETRFDTPPGS